MIKFPHLSSLKSNSVGHAGSSSGVISSVLPTTEPTDPQVYWQHLGLNVGVYCYGWSGQAITPQLVKLIMEVLAAGTCGATISTLSARLVKSQTGGSGTWSNVMTTPKTAAITGNWKWTAQGWLYNPTQNWYYGIKLWSSVSSMLTATFKQKDEILSRVLWRPAGTVLVGCNFAQVIARPVISGGSNPSINSTKYLHVIHDGLFDYSINVQTNFDILNGKATYGICRADLGDKTVLDDINIFPSASYHPLYDQVSLCNLYQYRYLKRLSEIRG
jgi:hypothetical protein